MNTRRRSYSGLGDGRKAGKVGIHLTNSFHNPVFSILSKTMEPKGSQYPIDLGEVNIFIKFSIQLLLM